MGEEVGEVSESCMQVDRAMISHRRVCVLWDDGRRSCIDLLVEYATALHDFAESGREMIMRAILTFASAAHPSSAMGSESRSACFEGHETE